MPLQGLRLALNAAAAILVAVCATAAPPAAPALDIARSFAAFGAKGVSSSGGTRLSGNAGASPGNAVQGLPATAFFLGEIITDTGTLRQAEREIAAAYADIAARPCQPPVYCVTSLPLSSMTLDGSATSVWIFKVAGPLVTLPGSSIVLRGGATYTNVFWQVDGPVTLGKESAFVGSILARGDITVGKDVSMSGHALSLTGSVKLDTDDVSCCDPIEFAPAVLSKGQTGQTYDDRITPSLGERPYRVSVFDGALPNGLTLANDGTLSGTPSTSGDFKFTVLAVDARGCSSIHTYTISVCGTVTVTFDVEPKPKTCEILSRKIVANGPIVVNGLPANGLSLLDGDTISGTPLAPVCIPIEVIDACSGKTLKTFQLCTECGPLPLPALSPPSATACLRYTADVTPSCGVPPFVYEPIVSPPWLTGPTNGIVSGIVSGTPPATGTYQFTVNVTDANGCRGTRTYTLEVLPGPPRLPDPPIDLKPGALCALYDSGALPGVLIEPATLPPGLMFVNSSLQGIPTESGKFCFQRTVPNALLCTSNVQEYCVTITCPAPPLEPLKPLQACLPASQPLTPPFCVPFACAVSSGTLPSGMTLDHCTLQGTPQLSDYNFCVTATPASCSNAITRCYSGSVKELQLSPPAGILPAATIGVGFSQTFTASGAPGPFTYLIGAPEIPPGLTFNQATGKLSGIPTVTGRYNFAVYAFEAGGACTSVVYTLDVGPVGPLPMGIPALSLWLIAVTAMALAAVAARRLS